MRQHTLQDSNRISDTTQKPTCKELYAFCNDKRFIYKHLDLFEERFMRIFHDNVQIINPVTLYLLYLSVPAEFDYGTCTSIISVIVLCQCGRGRPCHVAVGIRFWAKLNGLKPCILTILITIYHMRFM